jgi:hypothetical protein
MIEPEPLLRQVLDAVVFPKVFGILAVSGQIVARSVEAVPDHRQSAPRVGERSTLRAACEESRSHCAGIGVPPDAPS